MAGKIIIGPTAASIIAARQATPVAQPTAKKVISLKGITSSAGPATPLSNDPCDIYKRLLALGHPAEAESWLQLCNKNISGTTSGVSIAQQRYLAQLMSDYNLAATSRPIAIQITTLQSLIDFLNQLYAGNPNIKNIQQQIAAFQNKMSQLQAQAPTDTSGVSAVAATADGTGTVSTPATTPDMTTMAAAPATTNGSTYVDPTSGAPVQDPNDVASQAYADAISQGASSDDAASYANQMASATVSSNTAVTTKTLTTKQKAFFAGIGGVAGYLVMSSNPIGAVVGAVLGFFAPDVLKDL